MSKEIAKKLISELQTNEQLKAKVEGITDKEELVKKAVEAGYDVTLDELIEAEKEFRKETAEKNDAEAKKISLDDLDS
ncbi:MAG: Nif11-like leader peptide family natural product precursor, partial [Ruminiclostridium sp.]|nr:Nif11-like leader peptide family natural product precursor [Ruminiclostridium sp.]